MPENIVTEPEAGRAEDETPITIGRRDEMYELSGQDGDRFSSFPSRLDAADDCRVLITLSAEFG